MNDDNVEGRARVKHTPQLDAYYEELAEYDAGALWTVANDIEPWEPKAHSIPMIWRYRQLRPLVLRSLELVRPEEAGRRVVMLVNPKRHDVSAAVGLLYTGLQVMNPGEAASAHRHMASALRFIIEGDGAYTIVEGERVTLERNDFVITPNGTWHEHGNDSGSGPCIWQDGLDIPLINTLEANFYEVHPDLHQRVGRPLNASCKTYGHAGVRPLEPDWRKAYSPLLKYSWSHTYEALCQYAQASEGSPFDGLMLEYVNPITGGPVMPTMGAHMQMLRAGQATRAHRHTGNVIYHVAKGRGYSIIAGQRFDWEEHDIFCVPSWAWHEHVNLSRDDDACLFSFNDFPVMKSLSIYREEAYALNGGHQLITHGQEN